MIMLVSDLLLLENTQRERSGLIDPPPLSGEIGDEATESFLAGWARANVSGNGLLGLYSELVDDREHPE
jgi:hypothetical protein